jgi:hypothetical protein
VTESDIGWTAGILDGEGHLGIAKPPNYGVKVSVGNTDMRMLIRLRELWGGKIYFNENHGSPRNKPFWHWQIFGKMAYPMLRVVEPYLVVKRDQALLMLEMEQWHGKKTSYDIELRDYWRGQRHGIYGKLRLLTRKGAA